MAGWPGVWASTRWVRWPSVAGKDRCPMMRGQVRPDSCQACTVPGCRNPKWPHSGRTTTLDVAISCVLMIGISAGQLAYGPVESALADLCGSDDPDAGYVAG